MSDHEVEPGCVMLFLLTVIASALIGTCSSLSDIHSDLRYLKPDSSAARTPPGARQP